MSLSHFEILSHKLSQVWMASYFGNVNNFHAYVKWYEGVDGVDLLRVADSSWHIFPPCQAKAKRATLHLAVGEVEGEHLQVCLHVVHLFLMRLQYSQLSIRMAKYMAH